ncbi:DUF7344 domain-containing protein [Natronorubrum texcoconense]|uniref:DUF7344 domain-containing protein n=1 Tax=Natronorubrum texcoconense TaxID=1095776 RepID=A0A1G9H8R6_9EURY|nr:hypothetical protein [Natronorubrum texcoconense]SDL09346.1 hypothetical protein SAMN04515672_0150 [Natronorubrum texcoconense]
MTNNESGGLDGENGNESGGREKLSIDDATYILSSKRRRLAIDALSRDAPLTLRELADQAAALEYDTSVSELTGKERKRVKVSHTQTHLGELEDAGIMGVGDRGPIERGPAFENAVDILQELRNRCEVTEP